MSGAKCKIIIDNLADVASTSMFHVSAPMPSFASAAEFASIRADLQTVVMKCMCLSSTTVLVGDDPDSEYSVTQADVDLITTACTNMLTALSSGVVASIHTAATAFVTAVNTVLTNFGYPPTT